MGNDIVTLLEFVLHPWGIVQVIRSIGYQERVPSDPNITSDSTGIAARPSSVQRLVEGFAYRSVGGLSYMDLLLGHRAEFLSTWDMSLLATAFRRRTREMNSAWRQYWQRHGSRPPQFRFKRSRSATRSRAVELPAQWSLFGLVDVMYDASTAPVQECGILPVICVPRCLPDVALGQAGVETSQLLPNAQCSSFPSLRVSMGTKQPDASASTSTYGLCTHSGRTTLQADRWHILFLAAKWTTATFGARFGRHADVRTDAAGNVILPPLRGASPASARCQTRRGIVQAANALHLMKLCALAAEDRRSGVFRDRDGDAGLVRSTDQIRLSLRAGNDGEAAAVATVCYYTASATKEDMRIGKVPSLAGAAAEGDAGEAKHEASVGAAGVKCGATNRTSAMEEEEEDKKDTAEKAGAEHEGGMEEEDEEVAARGAQEAGKALAAANVEQVDRDKEDTARAVSRVRQIVAEEKVDLDVLDAALGRVAAQQVAQSLKHGWILTTPGHEAQKRAVFVRDLPARRLLPVLGHATPQYVDAVDGGAGTPEAAARGVMSASAAAHAATDRLTCAIAAARAHSATVKPASRPTSHRFETDCLLPAVACCRGTASKLEAQLGDDVAQRHQVTAHSRAAINAVIEQLREIQRSAPTAAVDVTQPAAARTKREPRRTALQQRKANMARAGVNADDLYIPPPPRTRAMSSKEREVTQALVDLARCIAAFSASFAQFLSLADDTEQPCAMLPVWAKEGVTVTRQGVYRSKPARAARKRAKTKRARELQAVQRERQREQWLQLAVLRGDAAAGKGRKKRKKRKVVKRPTAKAERARLKRERGACKGDVPQHETDFDSPPRYLQIARRSTRHSQTRSGSDRGWRQVVSC